MSRNAAASEYRALRSSFVSAQNARCTRYGTRATVDSFDTDAGRYVRDVLGVTNPSGADFVEAARGMVEYLNR
jgi:hypothetical protein